MFYTIMLFATILLIAAGCMQSEPTLEFAPAVYSEPEFLFDCETYKMDKCYE